MGASGSSTISTSSRVPAGTPDHDKFGDTFPCIGVQCLGISKPLLKLELARVNSCRPARFGWYKTIFWSPARTDDIADPIICRNMFPALKKVSDTVNICCPWLNLPCDSKYYLGCLKPASPS